MFAEAAALLLPSFSPIFPSYMSPPPPPEEEAAAAAHQRLLDELLDDDLFSTDIAADVPPLENLVHSSAVLEYDLGGEGDLFNAPEAIIETPVLLHVDPMTADLSLISTGEEAIASDNALIAETINAAGIESIQNDQLNDVIYECKKELLAKSVLEGAFPELPDVELPVIRTDSYAVADNLKLAVSEGPMMHKSVSAGCLRSTEWINGYTIQPNFLDFHGMELGAAFGLRRAFSEGDIQTLGNHGSSSGITVAARSIVFDRQSATSCSLKSEERKEKLSRYRRKKSKRDFGHKIKYACRKALADSQPRVRGRFARTEESPPPPPTKKMMP